MKAHLNIQFNVSDTFKSGDCDNCPFATISEGEGVMGEYIYECFCSLGYSPKVCPVEVDSEEEVE